MLPYALLAYAHHAVAFVLVGLLAAELALIGGATRAAAIARLRRIDAAYGMAAAAVLIIGFLRVFYGEKDAGSYFDNWVFWTKLILFLAAGLASLPPTLAIGRWTKSAKADAGFAPGADEVARLTRFMWLEAALLAPVPLFAAMMARGIGL